jgi:prepilin-type N-terminal cleavage/methylation domain-containing protein
MNNTQSRKGLTLLELVVVLVVLVALAGLLVPMMPGVLHKAHTSAGATNIMELTKWLQTYHALNSKYPDQFDSLCDDDGLYSKLPSNSSGAAGGQITYGALTATESSALYNAGITKLMGMAETTTNATFEPYDTGNDIPITTTSTPSVALADTARIETLFNPSNETPATSTTRYVIVGIGAKCTALGANGVMLESPIHFGDEAGANPTETYQRFAAVFNVSSSPAKFVGVVAIHEKNLDSAAAPLKEFWANH